MCVCTCASEYVRVCGGGEGVFVVSPDGSPYAGDNAISGGRVIALFGDNGRPVLNDLDLPTLTVANGSTLLLEGIDLKGNTGSRGLQAAGLVALDRVEIASNNGGGINATSTAELLIRNSIVAANGFSAKAIALNDGTLDVLYSAIGGTADPSAAISCSAGHTFTVRNSLLFNRNSAATLEGCSNATISQSAGDETLDGAGNTTFTVEAALFENLDNGNLRLTAAGKTQFSAVASWLDGDPPVDIDETARNKSDGQSDVAGAHLGP